MSQLYFPDDQTKVAPLTPLERELLDALKIERALADRLAALIEALDDTHWSSWQTTARFMPALEAAQDALAAHREARKGEV